MSKKNQHIVDHLSDLCAAAFNDPPGTFVRLEDEQAAEDFILRRIDNGLSKFGPGMIERIFLNGREIPRENWEAKGS